MQALPKIPSPIKTVEFGTSTCFIDVVVAAPLPPVKTSVRLSLQVAVTVTDRREAPHLRRHCALDDSVEKYVCSTST